MQYAGMQLLRSEIIDSSLAQEVAGLRADGTCNRCGQKQPVRLPSGTRYCAACINLGRVSDQETLCRFPATTLTPGHYLTWQGELTPAQAAASAAVQASVTAGRDHLLWAVTGAGKTEMLFETIAAVLDAGGRVGVAAPRIDVVRELAPRLQAAFAHTSMAIRYGGAPWPQHDVALTVLTTHQLLRYYQAFDLLIIDEVDAFPFVHNQALAYAAEHATRGAKVWLSATPPAKLLQAAKRGRLGLSVLPRRFHNAPLPVPKVAWLGRRRLPEQIDAKLIRQLATIVSTHRCLLFVPEIAWVPILQTQLQAKLAVPVAGVHASDPERADKVAAFRRGDIQLLITTTILERGVTIPKCAVMVLAADARQFDAASLIQMAGRAGRSADSVDDPVWFYARHYTRAMQLALRTIRHINHQAGF
ncbi:helicase-related protein [Lacticaseibacillus sp. GG6-2]